MRLCWQVVHQILLHSDASQGVSLIGEFKKTAHQAMEKMSPGWPPPGLVTDDGGTRAESRAPQVALSVLSLDKQEQADRRAESALFYRQ